MNKIEILNKVEKYLEDNFKNESTGHDYWHFMRVWKIAEYIGKKEGGTYLLLN